MEKYFVEVYVTRKKFWMRKYPFRETGGDTSRYFIVKTDKKKKNKIIRKCSLKGIRYKTYEAKWGRSGDYRRKFIRHNPPPYRCLYCHKKLDKDKMVVDHIIPVIHAKTGRHHARTLLRMQGIESVNDLKNLAPSCKKCNDAKRDHMGIWLIRAKLGKYNWYWKIRPVIRLVFFCACIYILYKIAGSPQFDIHRCM